jgi:hypothetical protein
VFEPGAFFDVTDREFHYCVFAVELVCFDHVDVRIRGDERVVSPLGPQPTLRWFGEPGAAHNQANRTPFAAASCGVEGLRDLGFAS